MAPDFALNLSDEGIELLHRDPHGPGWVSVAFVSLEVADLPAALRDLRRKAKEIGGQTFATKLILPASQLLYATIEVGDDPDADIAVALQGRTPYAVSDLQIDQSGTAPTLKIVAVAKETLNEAYEFLAPYELNPLGFTTIPDPEHFDKEPNLGPWPGVAVFKTDPEPVAISPDYAPAPKIAEPEPLEAPHEPAKPVAAFTSRRAQLARTEPQAPQVAPQAMPDKAPAVPTPSTPMLGAATPAKAPKKPAPIVPAPAGRAVSNKPAKIVEESRTRHDPIAELAALQAANQRRSVLRAAAIAAVLILGLGVVASTYFLRSGQEIASLPEAEIAPETDIAPVAENEASLPEPQAEPETLASLPLDTTLPDLDAPTSQEFVENEDISLEPTDPAYGRVPLDAQAAQTAYAVTGIWQLAPELDPDLPSKTIDDLYIAETDGAVMLDTPPILSQNESSSEDIVVASLPSPAPAGTRYVIDQQGFVVPSRDGAFTPDGVQVFEGRPTPAPLPRETEAQVAAQQPEATAPAVEPPSETVDPVLARLKPTQRPSNFAAVQERAVFGDLTRADLGKLRPSARPAGSPAQTEAIARAVAEAQQTEQQENLRRASLQPLGGTSSRAQNPAGELPTQLAALATSKPELRPRNFSRVVARAKRRQAATQTASASTASARATGPAVSRSSRAQPTGRTTATVARAATDNNAIALGKMSLVGVFGTSSNRRALLRLPNGRFKKVSVGDRVNGGKVAAIGDGVLKYTKSGRTLTLQMPRS